MKDSVIIALMILLMVLGYSVAANASWFNITGGFEGTLDAKRIKISAAGSDLRGYFFTPPGNPAYECVFIAGSQKGGAACYPKATQQ